MNDRLKRRRNGVTAPLRQGDLRRMAAAPVAMPVHPRINPSTGYQRARAALGQAGLAVPAAGRDEDLLRAYAELRKRTGLHPADLWVRRP